MEHEAGRRPINRATSWKEKERKEAKWRKKTTWFKQGGYSTVIFCPYTPDSQLAKRWREIEARGADSRGWRFKVVELGGRQVKSIICKNPWAGPCNDPRCFVDTTGGRGNCSRPGCNYTETTDMILCHSTLPRDQVALEFELAKTQIVQ